MHAVECPPTFNTDPSKVVGLIVGGESVFIKAVERTKRIIMDATECSYEEAVHRLKAIEGFIRKAI